MFLSTFNHGPPLCRDAPVSTYDFGCTTYDDRYFLVGNLEHRNRFGVPDPSWRHSRTD